MPKVDILKSSDSLRLCFRSLHFSSSRSLTTNNKMSEALNNAEADVKSQTSVEQKRISDYDYFINSKSKRRQPSALREITKKFALMPPHTISFAVGVPNVNTFPFEEISIKLKDGSHFQLAGKDLETALQYLPSSGYPKLVKQLQELQDRTHGVQDWSRTSVIVTCGSSEPLAAVLDMVMTEGDPIIIPLPLYTGAIDAVQMHKPEFITLEQDKGGIDPAELRRILQERKRQNRKMPKLLYINPTGCNPTGINVPLERKKEIYSLACEYNFLILEDDPYYALHFMEGDIASFLSLDIQGRVLRLDSFSKILSSGLRLGYFTAPSVLARRVELHLQTSTLHTSALSQVLVSKLLEYWGQQKYDDHIKNVKRFYKERRDLMIAACERHLKGLAEWEEPAGGMFLWMKIPSVEDTKELATKRCLDKYLLVLPGHPFAGQLVPARYNVIRLSYSLATPEQMDKGTKILADIIKEIREESK